MYKQQNKPTNNYSQLSPFGHSQRFEWKWLPLTDYRYYGITDTFVIVYIFQDMLTTLFFSHLVLTRVVCIRLCNKKNIKVHF